MPKQLSWIFPLLMLPIYLLPLGLRPLWIPDEARYGEISREMLASGNWIVPHFLDLRYFEKPVLGYWMNNLGQILFGQTNFAVRSFSAFSALLTGLLIYWLVRRALDCQRTALFSVTIYLTFFIVYMMGSFAVLDSFLALWLTAAFCAYYWAFLAETPRQRLTRHLLFGALCAAAFMTKGFIGLALPVIALVPFMLIQRRWLELILYGALAVVFAAVLVAPWAILVHLQEPDYWHYFFWEEHIRRFSGDDAQHAEPFWFYLPWLLLGAMPWALAIVPAIKSRVWQDNRAFYLYLALWFALPFALLSYASGKLPTYILPCFAPLAIFFGAGMKKFLDSAEAVFDARILKGLGWSNLIFAVVAGLGILVISTGLVSKSLFFTWSEFYKPILGLVVVGTWGGLAWWLLKRPEWAVAQVAAMPLAFMLLMPLVVPQITIDIKSPQRFLSQIAPEITPQTEIITNNVGLAGAIAWQYNKADILIWGGKGEVDYGLGYADAAHRYIPPEGITSAIEEKRKTTDVALLIRRKNQPEDGEFPAPDLLQHQGRFFLYLYKQSP
ncbi:lipid IV(A) 4-amino-4-deoxy-L-arabinosyltransferase [Rhodovibrionaceae bacterium A322]